VSKTALFIQHQRLAPPAMLGDAFAEAGYDTELLLVDETAVNIEFPDPRGFDVIIPLGATLPAYEPALLQTWVGAEMTMLREADRAGVPVLGVCFGGQLLAQAHGGTVSRWIGPKSVGTSSSNDPGLVPEVAVSVAVRQMDEPTGAAEIARNGNAVQAFVLPLSGCAVSSELDSDLLAYGYNTIPNERRDVAPRHVPPLPHQTKTQQDAAAERVRRLVSGFLNYAHCQR
jgi:hypothetical protein